MIAPHCLIELMEAHFGFRTSSPNHENGFVRAADCFVSLTGHRVGDAGEPYDGRDRPVLDSLPNSDSPVAFLVSGRGYRLALVFQEKRECLQCCRGGCGDGRVGAPA
jgi:hypothetical protein